MTDRFNKSGPLPREASFDPLLTNLAVAHFQDLGRFSVRTVFPIVPVKLKSGKYKVYEKGAFYRDEVKPRARGGTFDVTGFGMTEDSYTTEEEGLSTFIDVQDDANTVDPVKLEKAKIQLLTQQHHIHIERLWASNYFKTGVWGLDKTGVASAPGLNQFLQLDQAGVKIPQFIRKERDDFELSNGGFAANCLVVGKAVHRAITGDSAISDLIKYTQVGVPTIELLKQLFEVEHYVVPGAVWNSAPQGVAESMARIVGERDMLLCHRTAMPETEAPTAGAIFAWDGLVPGGGMEVSVNRWRPNPYAENFDVRMALGMKLVASDMGRFYSAAVSTSA
jgi:hypothetical protein